MNDYHADRLLQQMLHAWVLDVNSVPFPTIEAPEGQPCVTK